MKKNDTFTVSITDMSTEGLGIGKWEGMTFFIKDAVAGDTVRAGVTKLKKNYGYARVLEVLVPSPHRIEPPCPVARVCGGCQIQTISYDYQLRLKEKKVYDAMLRIGHFDEELLHSVFEPIVGMEEPFRYRNKAQVPAGADQDGNPIFGFYGARSHHVVPIDDCLLGVEENALVLQVIRDYMQDFLVEPYDEITHRGLLRHVLIRKGFASGELMVCLIVNGKGLPHEDALVNRLRAIPGMKSISVNTNTEKTNRILGEGMRVLWGTATITDTIFRVEEKDGTFLPTTDGVTFSISPKSFYQVNPVQTQKLYSLALDFADLSGQETVWDLYCGIGTISLFLAKRAKAVYGVEIIPEAIADAKRNATENGIENATFFVGKAEEVLPKWVEEHKQREDAASHPDVIVVDPPRKGCDERCLSTMLAMKPERIVYVSCDPATLARDLEMLCAGGYELRRVRPVDMFGNTMHVETVVLMSHISGNES